MQTKLIRKTYLCSDIIVILTILVIGIAFLPVGSGWQNIGYIIIVCDACLMPFYIHGHKIEGERGVFREETLPVSRAEEESILSFLNGDVATPDFKVQGQGGALISIYSQKGTGISYAQYYDHAKILEGITFPLHKITSTQKEALLNIKP